MFANESHGNRALARTSFLAAVLAVSLYALGGLSGCCGLGGSDSESSSTEKSASSGGEESASEGSGAGSKTERKELKHTAVTAELPSGAKMQKGGGMNATKIQWDTKYFLTIRDLKSGLASSLEEKKKRIKDQTKNLESMEVEELDDGWLIKGVKKSQLGTFHMVKGHREHDGGVYTCDGDLPEKEGFERAIEICKSLEPAAKEGGGEEKEEGEEGEEEAKEEGEGE